MTRYWVIRTDKAKTEYVAGELAHGRLRQGWGWTGEQDLRAIAADSQAGKSLNDAQKSTWRGNRRLLDSEPDGVCQGDIVLLPPRLMVARPSLRPVPLGASDRAQQLRHARLRPHPAD